QTLEDAVPGATLTLDFQDIDGSARLVAEFAEKFPLVCVVGVEDETTELAAEISRVLGLPHNSIESVRAARDKYRTREILLRSGIQVPRFWKFPAREDAHSIAPRVELPCVVKPLFLSASRGVIRCDDSEGFARAWQRLQKILMEPEVRRKGGELADWILVESYIPGEEVAVEGLLIRGELKSLALFDKPDPLQGPFFEETLYVTPSRLPEPTQRAILQTTALAAAALGLREGPIHAELRVNERGAWPLEVAARSIGGLCSRALRFGAGISLEEMILRQALGLEVGSLQREKKASGVMMIPIPRAGRLVRFDGADAALAVPDVEAVVQSLATGQDVVPLPEGSRYLGFIFARGSDPESVEAALREAHRRLKIIVD
ncbi:MAG: ATP-grasp domain-containing protein, partial [Acidobacteria bacterium]|nr:ATP-grasp domain-containing protein [Acidobacteriota bacterium]